MLQVHHILLQELAGHFTLKVLGDRFQLNGIKNLMHLPSNQKAAEELGSSPHTGGHLGSYRKIFCKFLGELQEHPSFGAAQNGDTAALDQLDAEMSGFLTAAKHALARGHLLTNTPSGMTQEEANKRVEDWYASWRTYAKDNKDSIQQMRDTVDQLHSASQWEGALRAPILLPDGNLSLADKIEILKRYKSSSPISQHFAAVGPAPDLPGLVPPLVDTRLPGLIPPRLDGLNEPEGFTRSNPLLTYGLPGFPVPPSDWHRLTRLPPSVAMPAESQVLQFHSETGQPLTHLSDGSQVLGPQAPPDPGSALLMGAGVLGAGLMMLPGAQSLGAGLLTGLTAAALTKPAFSATTSGGNKVTEDSVLSNGEAPYNPFAVGPPVHPFLDGWSDFIEERSGSPQRENRILGLEAERARPLFNRFGNWIDTPLGTVPTEPANVGEAPDTSVAASLAPENVRRLARVNESNAGSVFTSGSAPVPYLPSPEFNERFGSWTVPTAGSKQPPSSKPMGMFADEPSYLIAPPIFGVDGPGDPRRDAEEWFTHWIRPMLPPG